MADAVPRASTKFVWKRCIVPDGSGPAGTQSHVSGTARYRLQQRRLQEPLGLTVRYRGGSTARWEIKFRGVVRTFDGGLCLHDVLSTLYEDRWVSARER